MLDAVALRRRGIESQLVRYPREGHAFREPRHNLDRSERALLRLDRFQRAGDR